MKAVKKVKKLRKIVSEPEKKPKVDFAPFCTKISSNLNFQGGYISAHKLKRYIYE